MRALAIAAVLCASACVVLATTSATPKPPVFPLSWSATEHVYVWETDGSTDTIDQYSYWQQDASFNRTCQQVVGTSGPTLVSIVTDYEAETDYYIQGGICQFTCVDFSEICDGQDSLCTYDYINSAKFVSTTTFNGVAVNEYAWGEGIGPIPMNALQLYVDAATNSVPVFQYRDLEPFGTQEGYVNTTFKAGSYAPTTPPASVFNVPNINLCPSGDGDQCPDSTATRMQRRVHQARWLARAGAEALLDIEIAKEKANAHH